MEICLKICPDGEVESRNPCQYCSAPSCTNNGKGGRTSVLSRHTFILSQRLTKTLGESSASLAVLGRCWTMSLSNALHG